jgi:hypothetical protein
VRTKETKELGRILLKGENIVLVRTLEYILTIIIFLIVKYHVNEKKGLGRELDLSLKSSLNLIYVPYIYNLKIKY